MKTQVKTSIEGNIIAELFFALVLVVVATWLGASLMEQYPQVPLYLALTMLLGAVSMDCPIFGILYIVFWLLNLDGIGSPWLNLLLVAGLALALIVLGHLLLAYALACAGCAGVLVGEVWVELD